MHYWLRASGSPVGQALVLYFNLSSSGRFSFAFNVHIWAPRSLCADVIQNPLWHPGSRNMRPGPLSNAKHLPATAGKCKWQPAPASSLSILLSFPLGAPHVSSCRFALSRSLVSSQASLSLLVFLTVFYVFLFLHSDKIHVSPVMAECTGEENTCVRFHLRHFFKNLLHKYR